MTPALYIAQRKLRSFFVTPMIYILSSLFLCLAGLLFFTNLALYQGKVLQSLQPNATQFLLTPSLYQVALEPYMQSILFLLCLVVPILSMTGFPEERSLGISTWLRSLPVRPGSVLLGNFLAVSTVVVILILLAAFFPLCLFAFSEVRNSVEMPVFLAAIATLVFIGVCFSSIAILCSLLTDTPFLASVVGSLVLLALFFLHSLGELFPSASAWSDLLSTFVQGAKLISGEISLQAIGYFLSLALFSLALAVVVSSKRALR